MSKKKNELAVKSEAQVNDLIIFEKVSSIIETRKARAGANRYERRENENTPIGFILCTTASREQVEMLELSKSGITVAEYWTAMLPKAEFERKMREILAEARERLARRKMLTSGDVQREIDYFYESLDGDE